VGEGAWSKDLETGYEQIDAQHRELIRLIGELIALEDATEHELLCAMDTVLVRTLDHFSLEERLMRDLLYPERSAERMIAEHQQFRGVARVQLSGYCIGPIHSLIPLRQYISDFLTRHEFVTDRLFADWVRVKHESVGLGPEPA